MTPRRSGFELRVPRPLRHGPALRLIGIALALAGCAGNAGTNEEPRYPEKRRPAELRSASDGDVMGANGQSVDDTLEASPTNLHPAHGWEGEKGGTERAREAGDCDPDVPKAKNANATSDGNATEANASVEKGRPRSNKPCPKPAPR